LPEVNFHERIAVHHQEVCGILEKRCGEFHRAGSTHGMRLFGILNAYTPCTAIAESVLDFVGEIASTKHQTTNSLVTQLPNKQFKKRPVTDRGKGFGCGRQD